MIEKITLKSNDNALKSFVSTRLGGVSEGWFASNNMALHVGDAKEKVLNNRKAACCEYGLDFNNLTFTKQVHGNNIVIVDTKNKGRGAIDYGDATDDADGMITNIPGIVLAVLQADCVPLLVYDPVKKVIGAAHAGWRGTVDGIAISLIKKMNEVYKSNYKDLHVFIGPAIEKCCFEVGDEVSEEFVGKGFEPILYASRNNNQKYSWDLKAINKDLFVKQGVIIDKININNECTKCLSDKYFSYRAMNKKTGLFMAGITLG